TLQYHSSENCIELLIEPDKLEKVFYNLLSNAFKFTPEGGRIAVTVSRKKMSGNERKMGERYSSGVKGQIEGSCPVILPPSRCFTGSPVYPSGESRGMNATQYIEITVNDTGSGISREKLPHIFNRFYQVDNSNTRESEGTGIGLALAKELVELHGGEISVSSEEGKGTAFTVHLPLEKEHFKEKEIVDFELMNTEQAVRSTESNTLSEHSQSTLEAADEVNTDIYQSQISNPTSPNGQAEIILIVEDHPDVRAYIRDQLTVSYQVLEAINGEEGIKIAREQIPDLIITDVMMPKMDGYQMSAVLRKDEKTCHIPIIMLTAKASLEDKIEGLETGVDDYLIKPFSAKELSVRVANLIDLRRKLRERFRQQTVVKPAEVTATPMDQEFLEKVLTAVTGNLGEEQFDVAALAQMVGMSVSQLNRKLRALIDQPAGKMLRSMRLQRAADLLKQNAGTVAEICYEVGFGDQANFTRAFKKQFGVAPGSYRQKVN
ncbi:MAG: ATP-binding protein, partial [Calditrichia bacterium]